MAFSLANLLKTGSVLSKTLWDVSDNMRLWQSKDSPLFLCENRVLNAKLCSKSFRTHFGLRPHRKTNWVYLDCLLIICNLNFNFKADLTICRDRYLTRARAHPVTHVDEAASLIIPRCNTRRRRCRSGIFPGIFLCPYRGLFHMIEPSINGSLILKLIKL